jgi:hypothetical protein
MARPRTETPSLASPPIAIVAQGAEPASSGQIENAQSGRSGLTDEEVEAEMKFSISVGTCDAVRPRESEVITA